MAWRTHCRVAFFKRLTYCGLKIIIWNMSLGLGFIWDAQRVLLLTVSSWRAEIPPTRVSHNILASINVLWNGIDSYSRPRLLAY